MYITLSEGNIIDYTDKPNFVKVKIIDGIPDPTAVPQPVPQTEANAISVRGTLYNLVGSDVLADTPEAVTVEKSVADEIRSAFQDIDLLSENTNQTIEALENMLLDLDTFYSDQLAALQQEES